MGEAGDDSWQQQQDLMGVHGDVLFADPLGVRANVKPPAQQPAATQRKGPIWNERPRDTPGGTGQARAMDSGPDARVQPQEEPSWMRSMLTAVLNTGTQCCGNRSHGLDAAAASAAQSGRPPPETTFPPPTKGPEGSARNAPFENNPDDESEESDCETSADKRPPPAVSAAAPFAAGRRGPETGGSSNEYWPDKDFDGKRGRRPDKQTAPPAIPGLTAPPAAQAPPPPRQRSPERAPARAASPPREPPSNGNAEMPGDWQWPGWCLNFKTPCIEVYVNDEDTGEWKWCEAEPQSRVVNKAGHDAYLCAEYEWDGEFYVQDFGPQHVRKRGAGVTVASQLARPAASKPRRPNDNGGGVSALLDDTA